VEAFLRDVMPRASAAELLLGNSLRKNLVAITAPVHADAEPLFRWGNGFAWSYAGNVTDSIREKVKRAGGNVQADIRVSLAWHNLDDLDLHAVTPEGRHIHYANKAGILDVDMNAFGPMSREPVENLAFMRPRDGVYRISVNQFNRRETKDVGFTLEIENAARVEELTWDRAVSGTIEAAQITVVNGIVTSINANPELKRRGISQQAWGLSTETFVPISTVMLSPNHWGTAHGNKHYLFMLDGCRADEPVRGIYNEFLRPDLERHRKVFEVLGNRTKCPPAEEQLSGVGFSDTVRETATIRVSGSKLRKTYNVKF